MNALRRVSQLSFILALAGCGCRPPAQPGNFEALKARAHKLFAEGNYAEAIGPAQETVLAAEAKYGKDSPELADCIAGVGRIQAGLGKPAEAVIAFDQAMEVYIRAKISGPQFGKVLAWSAANLQGMKKYDQAEERYMAAMRILDAAGKEFAYELLSVAIDYAGLKVLQGSTDRAEDLLQSAIKTVRHSDGEYPALQSMALNNLGEIRYLRGDYKDALEYYEQALEMAIKEKPSNQRVITALRKNVENARGKLNR